MRPGVDFYGNLAGVVSMDDLLLRVEPDRARREPELGYRTIMKKDLPISVKKAVA